PQSVPTRRSSDLPDACVAELQRDASLGRLVKAGDAIEHGGLAGAVRPDQRRNVRALGDKREVVDGKETAEAHGEMVDAQDRGAHTSPVRARGAAMALRSLSTTVGSRV